MDDRASSAHVGREGAAMSCGRRPVGTVSTGIWRALLLRERAGAMARETGTPRGATAKLQAAVLAVQLDAGRCST
ncbi:hypothetical protein KC345_g114 [Hortaea werneckii]|nr:hypothetical protein KC345_g114 [Hortaea werneckii]